MFANCILVATFCSMGSLVRRKNTWHYSARKVMEFGLLMTDILINVSCKFGMYRFKIAQVISKNVRIAFLYVLNIYRQRKQALFSLHGIAANLLLYFLQHINPLKICILFIYL